MRRPHLNNLPALPVLPDGYALKELTTNDDAALALLLSAAFDENWTAESANEALLCAEDVYMTYGITHDGQLVATASSQCRTKYERDAGFVHWVATHPAHRRKGLAATLVIRVLHDLKQRNFETACLMTQTPRLAAIATYLKLGFLPEYSRVTADQRNEWSAVFQSLYAS